MAAKKYLDDNGLLYLWGKIKSLVTGAVPTKTSELTNDSGFITSEDVPEGVSPSSTTPKMDGAAAAGSETAYARGDHRHPSDTSKQNVIPDLETIRSGASAGATAYQKPSTGIPATDLASEVKTSLGLANSAIQSHQDISGKADKSATVSTVAYNTSAKKITKTINGTTTDVVTAAKIVTDGGGITAHQDISGKADKATTLAGYGITDAYSKTEVDAKMSSAYKPAGSISAVSGLGSLTAANEGKVYNFLSSFTTTSDFVEGSGKSYPAGTNVVIINTASSGDAVYKYDVLMGLVDLSGYVQSSDLNSITNAEIDTIVAS